MTIPTYATLDELKTRIKRSLTDTTDDTELTLCLSTASRRIERDCGRRFYADDSASANLYSPTHQTKLVIDDVSSTTGFAVATGTGSTFTALDPSTYVLKPLNAIAKGDAAWFIEMLPGFYWPPFWGWPTYYGSVGYQLVQVTAIWGWPSVPDPIHDACLLLAHRLWRRRDSPEGIAGSDALGGLVRVSRYDPDYDALIAPFVKPES